MEKTIVCLLAIGSCAFGQRYEGWTENPDGTRSYSRGRIVHDRDIDAELRAREQASWNMYLKVVEQGHKQTQDYIDKMKSEREHQETTELLQQIARETERANEESRRIAEATKKAMETLAREAERANEERRSVAEAAQQAMERRAGPNEWWRPDWLEKVAPSSDAKKYVLLEQQQAKQPTTSEDNWWAPYAEEEKRRNAATAAGDQYTQPATATGGDQWWAADVEEEKRRRAEEAKRFEIPTQQPVKQPACDSAR
jgi:hypothetical protein